MLKQLTASYRVRILLTTKPFLFFLLACIQCGSCLAQARQQLLAIAVTFPDMPRQTSQLSPYVVGAPTFSSGTPMNDIEYTIFDTDYMEGETSGYDLFMPVDPADATPGANKVKLVRCVNNLDLDVSYGAGRGDRVILGTADGSGPFFRRGSDNIDNDYAVIQNFDYNNGHIQLKGLSGDYRLEYFTKSEGVQTEGYYLFYVKNQTTPDLIAFIFPCGDLGLPISETPPSNPSALCNSSRTLSLTNSTQFRYATAISSTIAIPKGIAQVGSSGKEVVGALATDSQGNSYLCGLTDGNLDGNTDASNELFITKLNKAGQIVWTTELATAEGTLLIDAKADGSHLYAVGRTLGALSGFTSAGRWDYLEDQA
jgi:hypothetical protein